MGSIDRYPVKIHTLMNRSTGKYEDTIDMISHAEFSKYNTDAVRNAKDFHIAESITAYTFWTWIERQMQCTGYTFHVNVVFGNGIDPTVTTLYARRGDEPVIIIMEISEYDILQEKLFLTGDIFHRIKDAVATFVKEYKTLHKQLQMDHILKVPNGSE